jgi:flavin-dependent dehydrogenase
VHRKPYDLQREFVNRLRARGIVSGESVRTNFTPFIIPVGGPLKRPGRGRVLLAGDAGGFVNGFTAEGIYYAMATGELAARAVLKTPADRVGPQLARAYSNACRREFGAELHDSVRVQRFLFSDRRRIARLVRSAQRDPAVGRMIAEYATGTTPYATLKRRAIFQAPLGAARILGARIWSNVLLRS